MKCNVNNCIKCDFTLNICIECKKDYPLIGGLCIDENEPEQTSEEEPIFTPEPTYIPEVIDKIEISNDITEAALNESLTSKFENIETDDENVSKIVEIIGTNSIPFNTQLKDDQFIKPQKGSTVFFNGGNLNLVIPEKVTITIPKTEESKLTLKGAGDIVINFKEAVEEEEPTSINLKAKSQINGSVTITVPEKVTTFSIDSLELDSKSQISVNNNNNNQPIQVNIKEITTLKNANAKLSDLKIENSLIMVQSSILSVDNVDFKDAIINYNIDDYLMINKDQPFFIGKFNTLPRSFLLTDSKDENNKPSEKVEYTILYGTFENMKCQDWYSKINLDNSGFNSKVCKDIEESKLLDSENKMIVVQFDPSIKDPDGSGKKKSSLGPGGIAGIVIGVVAVIAIVVVVVIFVKRKKKSKSENEETDFRLFHNKESGSI